MNIKENKNCGIYCWKNLKTNKWYIGQSSELKNRKRAFLRFNKLYSGDYINRARQKYNKPEYWEYSILKYCKEEELDSYEWFFITTYNCNKIEYGYNLNEGGSGNRGFKVREDTKKKLREINKGKKLSEETKQKLREINKGENNGFFGKHHTEETKMKISETKKGKPSHRKGIHLSEDTKKKLSESHKGKESYWKGKHLTEEAKKKISKTLSNAVYQINPDTDEIIKKFDSIYDAAKELGVNKISHISDVCKGKRKTTLGFKWRYVS